MSHCSVDEKVESATPAMHSAMRTELQLQRRLAADGELSKERFHLDLATTLYTARAGEILEISGEDGEVTDRHQAYVGIANDPDLAPAP
jgi:hypothetical protein